MADIVKHYIFTIWLENSYNNLFREGTFSKRVILNSVGFLRKWNQVFNILRLVTFDEKRKSGEVSRLRRFDNINLAHLKILEKAYSSGVNSIVVFEDDARVQNPASLTEALNELLYLFSNSDSSFIANISLSNSPTEMGVNHILGLHEKNDLFFESLIPFTNSASCNIYNAGFINNFHTSWNKLVRRSMKFFIPVDWILNYIILESIKSRTDLRTLHMNKPIAYQLSMASNQIIFEESEK